MTQTDLIFSGADQGIHADLVTDDFATDKTSYLWTASYGDTVTGGVVNVAPTAGYAAMDSGGQLYDLTSSCLAIKMTTPNTGTGAQCEWTIFPAEMGDGQLGHGTACQIQWDSASTTISFRNRDLNYGDIDTTTTLTGISAGTTIWVAFVEGTARAAFDGTAGTTGNLYYFTSTTGNSGDWTLRKTVVVANLPSFITNARVLALCNNTAGTSTAVYDNFNLFAPQAITAADTGSGADAYQVGSKAADTGAGADAATPATALLGKVAAGLFVAVSGNSTATTVDATSSNATTWTSGALPVSDSWSAIAYGNGVFVAVTSGTGTSKAASSTDGVNWTQRSLPAGNNWASIVYGNGKFVAISGQATAVSTDGGATWSPGTLPSSQTWTSVTYGNGVFVAIADWSAAAATSTDGITWAPQTLPSNTHWYSVAYGGGVFVAVGASTAVASSPDGITWTPRTNSGDWSSVCYGNGQFVSVNNSGSTAAATSPNGTTWTPRTLSSTGNAWRSVTYGGGLFVVVEQGGSSKVLTSSDGITWATYALPSSQQWDGVVYGLTLANIIATDTGSGADGVSKLGIQAADTGSAAEGTSVDTGVLLAKISTLTDDFSTQDTAKWYFNGTSSASGGYGHAPALSGGYTNIISSFANYDATASTLTVDVNAVPTGGVDPQGDICLTSATAGTDVRFSIKNGTLRFQSNVGYSDAGSGPYDVTYSSTTHRYMQFVEAAGTLLYQTSSDGSTWTTRRSITTPAWWNNVQVNIQAFNISGTSSDMLIDDVNVVGSAAAISSADTGAGSDAATPATASISASDTGHGIDAATPAAATFTNTDTGHGTDATTPATATFTSVETGAGADAVTKQALTSADTGAGTDAGGPATAAFTSVDTGSGADAVSKLGVAAADTATGLDAAVPAAAAFTSTDTVAGVDSVSRLGQQAADTGHGADASTPVAAALISGDVVDWDDDMTSVDKGSIADKNFDDYWHGTDIALSLAVALGAADTATALEAGRIALGSTDTAAAVETGRIAFGGASDIATGADTSAVTATLGAAESGHGADAASTSAGASGQDTGSTVDTGLALAVSVTAADTGAAVEDASVDQGTVPVSSADLAHAVDLALGVAQSSADSGSWTDVAAVALQSHDVATAAEAAYVSVFASDSGVGSDTFVVLGVSSGDSGTTTEGTSTSAPVRAGDQVRAVDAATIVVALTAAETATFAELLELIKPHHGAVFTGKVAGPGGSSWVDGLFAASTRNGPLANSTVGQVSVNSTRSR